MGQIMSQIVQAVNTFKLFLKENSDWWAAGRKPPARGRKKGKYRAPTFRIGCDEKG